MADQNLTELTADTNPALTELAYEVKDPAGTPLDRSVTWDAIRKLFIASRHKAKMTRDAAQSIPDATPTKIAFDAETYDIGSIASTATGRFTILQDAPYLIICSLRLPGIDDGEQVQPHIYINGVVAHSGAEYSVGADDSPFAQVSDSFDLNATDYIEMYVYQNSGDAQNTDTATAWKPKMTVVEL